jgi:hypothetical protein
VNTSGAILRHSTASVTSAAAIRDIPQGKSNVPISVNGKPVTIARVFRSLRRRLSDRVQPINAFRGVYGSFAEAERAAPRDKPLGYDAADASN